MLLLIHFLLEHFCRTVAHDPVPFHLHLRIPLYPVRLPH